MQFSYKIKNIYIVFLFANIQLCTTAFAQVQPVKKFKIYRRQIQSDSLLRMVELRTIIPDIVYDLRYSTNDNFTRSRLYKNGSATFLRIAVATALKKAIADLNQQGYGLKVFDAYRPYSVTKKMWQLIHDERYVANPSKGSGHNRGLAIDISLISLKNGAEVSMGTGFDNFSDSAHHSFKNLPGEVLKNRSLLKQTMEKYGFNSLETEWWHYSWPNDRNYDVLDLDFKDLSKSY